MFGLQNMKTNAGIACGKVFSILGSRLVIPPTCAGCGILIAEQQALCASCWKRLHFISAPFCRKYAVPFSYATAEDALSPEAYRYPPPWAQARAALQFKDLGVDLVHGLKYGDRHDYARLMARLMASSGADLIASADHICPVPLHWRRLVSRRYNQSALLARQIARAGRKPFSPHLLTRRKPTRTQVGLTREARERNLQGAFAAAASGKKQMRDRNILLVDDVMTSGATLAAASRALLKAGAKEVNVLVFARVTDVLE